MAAARTQLGNGRSASLPGLTRQSIYFRKKFYAKKMDARVKPAHDDLRCADLTV
jgi:hypothetical protein